MDHGFDNRKTQGHFSKNTGEPVCFNLSRRSSVGRLRRVGEIWPIGTGLQRGCPPLPVTNTSPACMTRALEAMKHLKKRTVRRRECLRAHLERSQRRGMDEDDAGLDSADGHVLQRSAMVRETQRPRERGKGQLRLHHLKPKEGGRTLTTVR